MPWLFISHHSRRSGSSQSSMIVESTLSIGAIAQNGCVLATITREPGQALVLYACSSCLSKGKARWSVANRLLCMET